MNGGDAPQTNPNDRISKTGFISKMNFQLLPFANPKSKPGMKARLGKSGFSCFYSGFAKREIVRLTREKHFGLYQKAKEKDDVEHLRVMKMPVFEKLLPLLTLMALSVSHSMGEFDTSHSH